MISRNSLVKILPFLIGSLFHLPIALAASKTTNQADDTNNNNNNKYMVIGVSGGLQGGFPDHKNLDFHYFGQPPDDEEEQVVPAVFLGRGLVRGYKAFLDVMQDDWRQYIHEEPTQQPLINCNVLASGCWHHANEYWMYLIDARQFASILMNEPRFLSITPDLGLVDLEATETGPVVRYLARHQIATQGKTAHDAVAFPIVTAAWYNPASHVPSPVLYTKADGTQVTNFPHSLAKWAGVLEYAAPPADDNDESSISNNSGTCAAAVDTELHCMDPDENDADQAHQRQLQNTAYWDGIRRAIRHAEANRLSPEAAAANGPPFQCEKKARFGVSKEQARINYPFEKSQIRDILKEGGFVIDFDAATVTPV